RKQLQVLYVALPCTAFGFAAAYIGSSSGLAGVAVGIAVACFVEFLIVNAYALSHFSSPLAVAAELAMLCATAAAWLGAAVAVERLLPVAPWPLSAVGGWPLLAVGALGVPLLVRAVRRVHALQGGPEPAAARQ